MPDRASPGRNYGQLRHACAGAALCCTPAKEVANLVGESFISSWRREESKPAAELPLESEEETHDMPGV